MCASQLITQSVAVGCNKTASYKQQLLYLGVCDADCDLFFLYMVRQLLCGIGCNCSGVGREGMQKVLEEVQECRTQNHGTLSCNLLFLVYGQGEE